MLGPELKLEHTDSRGEIYSISLPDGHEVMLLRSVAGSLRGGHSHSCPERVVLLSGEMRYWLRQHGQDTSHILYAGDAMYHDENVIHMGDFISDSWLIECKLAKKGEWTQQDYEPYRAMVRENASRA